MYKLPLVHKNRDKMMMEKLGKAGRKTIAVIGIMIAFFLVCFSWRYSIVRYPWGSPLAQDSFLGNLLFFLFMAAVLYAVQKSAGLMKTRDVHMITIVLSFFVCGILFWMIPQVTAIPQGDQLQVYVGTKWWLEGDFKSISEYDYFRVYPFQLSFIKLQSYVLGWLGRDIEESYRSMQYINAVFVAITFYASARIAKELFDSVKAEAVCLVLEILFLPMYLYTFFHYGEPIGTCCAVLVIYFFLLAIRENQRKPWLGYVYAALAALALFVVCITRGYLLIVGVAMLILSGLIFMRRKKIWPFAVACFCMITALLGYRSWNARITEQSGVQMDKGEPLILLVAMGLQGGFSYEDGPGGYSGYNWETFIENQYDADAAARIAAQDIKDRLVEWAARPQEMVLFFKNKQLHQWIEASYSSFTSTNLFENPKEWVMDLWYGDGFLAANDYLDGYQSMVYLLLLGYFIQLFFKDGTEKKYLPGLIFIGEFLFSLVWENQSRYIYPYIVIILPGIAGSLICYYESSVPPR